MSGDPLLLSVVIPSYGRERVLADTLRAVLALPRGADEVLVIDQTETHDAKTESFLSETEHTGAIRWIRHRPAGIVGAMNRGLAEARGDIVLFLDDDIVPSPSLVEAHRRVYAEHPEAWAVAGRVLQPEDLGENAETLKAETLKWGAEGGRGANAETLKGEQEGRTQGEGDQRPKEGASGQGSAGEPQNTQNDAERRKASAGPAEEPCRPSENGTSGRSFSISAFQRFSVSPGRRFSVSLRSDLDFRFSGTASAWVENVMAGNLSVRRDRALAIGGFDPDFVPPVSFRFETAFAKRLVAAGGRIRFEPAAEVRHLRATRGGTRIHGNHLASASPLHGVGDYVYALKHGRGLERLGYIARRPFREVRTRFHLRHPWFIPVKFVGELRALFMALRLARGARKTLKS